MVNFLKIRGRCALVLGVDLQSPHRRTSSGLFSVPPMAHDREKTQRLGLGLPAGLVVTRNSHGIPPVRLRRVCPYSRSSNAFSNRHAPPQRGIVEVGGK